MSTTIYPPGPLTFVPGLLPISMDESANGESIDCSGYGGWKTCLLSVGSMDVGTLAVKVQHSDDSGTWTDITGAAFPAITDVSGSGSVKSLTFFTTKRYIRLSWANGAAFALMSAVFGLSVRPNLFGGAL